MDFVSNALGILGATGPNETNLRLLEGVADHLVPFVGAGLSAPFGYPTWRKFLLEYALYTDDPGLRAQVNDYLENNEFEEAAQLCSTWGNQHFHDYLQDKFHPGKLHRPIRKGAVRHLPGIARGTVLTTNFDRVLECAYEDAEARFESILRGTEIYQASRAILQNKPFLLKLHGDYAEPGTRVFTLEDYRREYGAEGEVDFVRPLPAGEYARIEGFLASLSEKVTPGAAQFSPPISIPLSPPHGFIARPAEYEKAKARLLSGGNSYRHTLALLADWLPVSKRLKAGAKGNSVALSAA